MVFKLEEQFTRPKVSFGQDIKSHECTDPRFAQDLRYFIKKPESEFYKVDPSPGITFKNQSRSDDDPRSKIENLDPECPGSVFGTRAFEKFSIDDHSGLKI